MKPVPDPPGRITIQDIADKLGISKATVSRALTNRSQTSPETRQKVLKMAKELGYRPDPTLRALSSLRWSRHPESRATYRIALLNLASKTGDSASTRPMEPSHAGAMERAAELGLQLDICKVRETRELMRFGNMLYHRGYDAILFGMKCPVEDWKFPFDKFPCLTISYIHPAHRIHQVTSDWFNAVSIAFQEILARDYKRPGFAFYCRGNPSIDERITAAMHNCHAKLERQLGAIPSIFDYAREEEDEPSKHFFDRNRDIFLSWYRNERPDVVIDSGFLAYWWLRDAGVTMPADTGYLRLLRDWTDNLEQISSIDHNLALQGRWAIDTLFNMIQTNNRGFASHPVRLTVACELHEGSTLRPRQ